MNRKYTMNISMNYSDIKYVEDLAVEEGIDIPDVLSLLISSHREPVMKDKKVVVGSVSNNLSAAQIMALNGIMSMKGITLKELIYLAIRDDSFPLSTIPIESMDDLTYSQGVALVKYGRK